MAGVREPNKIHNLYKSSSLKVFLNARTRKWSGLFNQDFSPYFTVPNSNAFLDSPHWARLRVC